MPELWIPGAEGPDDAFLERLHRLIEKQGPNVVVEVELRDGSRFEVTSIEREPGFGFITLAPAPAEDVPAAVIVPIGTISQIRLHAPEEEPAFGFQAPSA
jgi:hypothetical protein